MTFEFHPEALAEFEEAAVWYEKRRDRLGFEFADAVEAAISRVLASPEQYAPIIREIRVIRLKRFPYSIFYRFDSSADCIRVVAVMHHRRRPDCWHHRQ